jgi:hypothetical protein
MYISKGEDGAVTAAWLLQAVCSRRLVGGPPVMVHHHQTVAQVMS